MRRNANTGALGWQAVPGTRSCIGELDRSEELTGRMAAGRCRGPQLILALVILVGAAVPVPALARTVGIRAGMSSARATRGGSTMSACRSGPDRH